MNKADVEAAIKHFEYGIKCDIFSEPVASYAKLAVKALKSYKKELYGNRRKRFKHNGSTYKSHGGVERS